MTETGGDMEMLLGISKHMANLSDNKKQRVSTTFLALQETFKDKLVSISFAVRGKLLEFVFLFTAKVQGRKSKSASGATIDPSAHL